MRLTVAAGRGRRETSAFVVLPGAGLVRDGDADAGYAWSPISRATVLQYRQVTRGLSPFPAAGLEGAGGASSWPWLAAGGALVLLVTAALVHGRPRRLRPERPTPA